MRKVIIVLLFSRLLSGCGPMKGIEASEVSDSNAKQSQGPISSATSGSPKLKAGTKAEEYVREKKREILAGLQGVQVIVEDFSPEVEKYVFNKQQYKTDVELRLRQYGVKVFSEEESLQVSGSPFLYINVNPVIVEKVGVSAVNILVKLNEVVSLERNPSVITIATMWQEDKTLLLGLNRLDKLREYVRDLVDMFINDYLAANPKDQPSKKDSTTKTIQQTDVVPKNALLDMITCAEIFRLASDPNLPQEKKVMARKGGLELLVNQKVYLENKLGLGEEDILARMSDLKMGLRDNKQGLFGYLE